MATYERALSCGDSDDLDPRIQVELETLNTAADNINKLENELQAAQTKFIRDKAHYRQKLDIVSEQVGAKFVTKAHTYYDLLQRSQRVQADVRRSAERFSEACTECDRAKQLLTTIELQATQQDVSTATKVSLDTWKQDKLNAAIESLTSADREKMICELDHQAKTIENLTLQQRLATALKDASKAVERARPFYNLKDRFESQLQALKQTAEDLALALKCSKQRYQAALGNLESISEEVHEQRRMLLLPPRTPGVGAESADDELLDWPSTVIDMDARSDPSHCDSDNNSCGSSTLGESDIDPVTRCQLNVNAGGTQPSTDSPVDGSTDRGCTVGRDDSLNRTDATRDEISASYLDSAAASVSDPDTATSKLLCESRSSDDDMSYTDRQGDGAEDPAAGRITEEPTSHHRSSATESLGSESRADSVEQKERSRKAVVAVGSLSSGVYVAKSAKDKMLLKGSVDTEAEVSAGFPRIGSEASMVTNEARNHRREQRRQQMAAQFPLLCNLGNASQVQLGTYLNH